MAHYQISTNFVPRTARNYIIDQSTLKTALWQSGIVVGSPDLAARATSAGGIYVDIPVNNTDLVIDAAVQHQDDTANDIVPLALTSHTQRACIVKDAQAWKSSYFAEQITTNKAGNVVADVVGKYWARTYQKDLLDSLTGIVLDNTAANSSDMQEVIYDDIASPLAANKPSTSAFVDARGTMGDAWSDLGAIAMHSATRRALMKLEPNSFIPASETNIGFDLYNGMVILEDDAMPVTTGTNSDEYTSYIFGPGAFHYGAASGLKNEAIDINELGGVGAGDETLITRRTYFMHPNQFEATSTSASAPLTVARKKLAACWSRLGQRKNVKIAVLRHNV